MITCEGCIYRKGMRCAYYRRETLPPSRRCRHYRTSADEEASVRSLAACFLRFRGVPPRR